MNTVGFEREWSSKDIGVRAFEMTAIVGLLSFLLGSPLLLLAGGAVLLLIVFADLRELQVQQAFGVFFASGESYCRID